MVRADEPAFEALAEQTDLREGAEALTARVEEAGWSLAPPPGQQARSLLGRLIGGEGAAPDDVDPITEYLGATGSLAAVASDIANLSERTSALAASARAVADAPQGLTREALERDIAAAERALGAVRRARTFFAEAAARADTGDGPVQTRLGALKTAETELAEAADALAERRWSGHGLALSG